jgi:hypothetical protein
VAARSAQTNSQTCVDQILVAACLPHVEEFLAELPSVFSSSSVNLAELVLVPTTAVQRVQGWHLTSAEARRKEGESVRVALVQTEAEVRDEKSSKSASVVDAPREFDEWGRWTDDSEANTAKSGNTAWWKDEGLARRIASYLRPKEPAPSMDRREVRAAVQSAKDERRGWTRLGRRKNEPVVTAQPDTHPSDSKTRDAVAGPDGVQLGVRVEAQEVTFRRENDFGIWESLSGWGIVVVVKMKRQV